MNEKNDWYNVICGKTFRLICQISCEKGKDPYIYDPRKGGDGNVIWQLADKPLV